jgi:N-carbamoylputrescine amidase
MSLTHVAAIQMAMSSSLKDNLKKAEKFVRAAAKAGANIVLLPELFMGPYFCQVEDYAHFELATPLNQNAGIKHFQKIAQELGVVLPISYFEKDNNVFYNSIAIINADGQIIGHYRKSHIPTGESYEEKFYFKPGDTGFKVFETKFGKLGVAICWDQWFPEAARIMALNGAELLLYPTAIGSEPTLPLDSQKHWTNAMVGHAASNLIPVIAANRIGIEKAKQSSMTFYGSSFITNYNGEILKQMDRITEGFVLQSFDLKALEKLRYSWGVFRDRRPDLYGDLIKK